MSLFDLLVQEAVAKGQELASLLAQLPEPERIEALNRIRQALHEVSPFQAEPVDCVLWVPADQVRGNDYNPNNVAPPEMRLLEHSIAMDGYTQPIVAWPEGEGEYVVVDGFHRHRVGKESKRVRQRIRGYLPITLIRPDRADIKDRMAATIRHNRARGVHGVVPMAELVARLIREGWTDSQIARELGMDPDEVLRFKQATGLPSLFRDHPYSRAWE
ncbi:MAG: ParB/RepB/Spo0J family partition protein [Bacillota bacterium]